MSATLRPLPLWSSIVWGRPESPRSDFCSYADCLAYLTEDEVPLILWKPDGSAAQFCTACQRRWWGVTALPQEPEEDY